MGVGNVKFAVLGDEQIAKKARRFAGTNNPRWGEEWMLLIVKDQLHLCMEWQLDVAPKGLRAAYARQNSR